MTHSDTKARPSRTWKTLQSYVLIGLVATLLFSSGCGRRRTGQSGTTTTSLTFTNATTSLVNVTSTSVGSFGAFGGQIGVTNIQPGSSFTQTYTVPNASFAPGASMGTLAGNFVVGTSVATPLPSTSLVNGTNRTFVISGTDAAPVITANP